MGYKDIDICDTYETGVCEVVEDFYIPVLSQSLQYDRIAGFFSSATLSIVARGMAGFIMNGGKMRLITSPRLSKQDYSIIEAFTNHPDTLSVSDLGLDLDGIEDEFEKNHLKALGWMLQQGSLEIKLAVVYNEDGSVCTDTDTYETGLFHQKVGILVDTEGNRISFSGSINETAAAWVNNDEEFKVFKEWESHANYFESDRKRFSEIWNGDRANIKVFSLPSAVKNKLVDYSKDFKIETITADKYHKRKRSKIGFKDFDIPLFYFQAEALDQWKKNDYKQLFVMATGCGKTRTAIAGTKYLLDSNKKLITIVSTPQNTLTKQWIGEFHNLGVDFDDYGVFDGTNQMWKQDLELILHKIKVGRLDRIAIFTTHTTASSDDFINIICRMCDESSNIVFIGDETHWLGAKSLRKALLPIYKYRIGLSATPSRWFDDSGTRLLEDYYGNNQFEFTITDALTHINPITNKHFLTNYYYNLSKVELNDQEVAKYKKLTHQLLLLSRKIESDSDSKERYDRLLEQRADIIKNAESKYAELDNIIQSLSSKGELENLIIFVSPKQIKRVCEILAERGVIAHRITQREGTTNSRKYGGISEREYIIQHFKSNDYQALVAIKCLDEGIDIPSACRGILMASSTNPREYVQRIGRIIRQDEGKNFAYLYDMYVSSVCDMDEDDKLLEKKIRQKEHERIKEIASNAINHLDSIKIINNIQ